MSTKAHVPADAPGNSLGIVLTPGQASDLKGADAPLPGSRAGGLLADKAYGADERIVDPLDAAGKTAVIPPRRNRRNLRPYDGALYEARHLVENLFCGAKRFRGIATRCDKTAGNFLAPCHMAAALCWLN